MFPSFVTSFQALKKLFLVGQDPEIQQILQDPVISNVLRDLQSNPQVLILWILIKTSNLALIILSQAAQDALKDPVIAERIQKLAAAGILSFG